MNLNNNINFNSFSESPYEKEAKKPVSYSIGVFGGHARKESYNSSALERLRDTYLSHLDSPMSVKSLTSYTSLEEFKGLGSKESSFNDIESLCLDGNSPFKSISPSIGSNTLSPIELFAVFEKKCPECANITSELENIVNNNPNFYQELTITYLDQTDSLLHFTNLKGKSKLAPQRDIDLSFTCGDEQIMDQYKKQVYDAISKLSSIQTKHWKVDYFNEEVANLSNLLNDQSESNFSTSSINFRTGELHYDNAEKTSVKHPFLRTIQHYVVLAIIQSIRNGQMTEELFLQMPQGIPERIQWFSRNKLWDLRDDSSEALQEDYKTALSYYSALIFI